MLPLEYRLFGKSCCFFQLCRNFAKSICHSQELPLLPRQNKCAPYQKLPSLLPLCGTNFRAGDEIRISDCNLDFATWRLGGRTYLITQTDANHNLAEWVRERERIALKISTRIKVCGLISDWIKETIGISRSILSKNFFCCISTAFLYL